MNIIVCLKEVIDTRLSLGYCQVENSLFKKGLSYRLDPSDMLALNEALKLKSEDPDHQVILLSLGSERVKIYLKEGLGQLADKAVWIWEDCLKFISTYQTAKILARAAILLQADLVLTGNKSMDNGSGLVGPLMAAWWVKPCLCEVTDFHLEKDKQAITVTRSINKVLQEKLLIKLPAVLAITGSLGPRPSVSLEKLLASQETEITHLVLADLGISPGELQHDPVEVSRTCFPCPRPKAAPLDSSLPAYYRILAFLEGGMAKRRGQILQGSVDELVDQLYDLLIKDKESYKYDAGDTDIV